MILNKHKKLSVSPFLRGGKLVEMNHRTSNYMNELGGEYLIIMYIITLKLLKKGTVESTFIQA